MVCCAVLNMQFELNLMQANMRASARATASRRLAFFYTHNSRTCAYANKRAKQKQNTTYFSLTVLLFRISSSVVVHVVGAVVVITVRSVHHT